MLQWFGSSLFDIREYPAETLYGLILSVERVKNKDFLLLSAEFMAILLDKFVQFILCTQDLT